MQKWYQFDTAPNCRYRALHRECPPRTTGPERQLVERPTRGCGERDLRNEVHASDDDSVTRARSAARRYFVGASYDAFMASGTNNPDPGRAHRARGLSRVLGHAASRHAAATCCYPTKTHDLVTHSHNEELLEESGRELTALSNREAALLSYIKSRDS